MVIAYSENTRVGIDIEKISTVDFQVFFNFFTSEIWSKIYTSRNKYKTFYNFWTLYESVVKADGRGIELIESNVLDYKEDKILLGNTVWYNHVLNISSEYSCTLSTSIKNPKIFIKEIF